MKIDYLKLATKENGWYTFKELIEEIEEISKKKRKTKKDKLKLKILCNRRDYFGVG